MRKNAKKSEKKREVGRFLQGFSKYCKEMRKSATGQAIEIRQEAQEEKRERLGGSV